MKIDALCSERQYLDALSSIWAALPERERGDFIVPDHLHARARQYGIEPVAWHEPWAHLGLVASERDLRFLRGKPAVLCEHGAGQSYGGDPGSARHPGYAGGDGRDNVVLFLVPGAHPAQRNRGRYPDTPCVEIGSLHLDRYRSVPVTNHPPTVAFAFHWGCGVTPESGSAWYHWRDHLEQLGDQYRLIGTGHPRAFGEFAYWYDHHGILAVEDIEAVFAEADILVADNTSVMYDWAAMDRPVVTLNCPEYRRQVRHGLRFWDHIPGPMAHDAVDLIGAVEMADDRASRKARERAARAAYTHSDRAGQRGAQAILDHAFPRVEVPSA